MPYPAIKTFCGSHIGPYLDDLKALQERAIKDGLHLIGGIEDIGESLDRLSTSKKGMFVCAFDGIKLVGAATGGTLDLGDEAWEKLFEEEGYAAHKVFHMRGALLAEPFRGQGVGAQFYEEREAHARRLGCRYTCIWVPDDGPTKNPYQKWWKRRSYRSHPQLRSVRKVPASLIESGQQQGGFWLKRLS